MTISRAEAIGLPLDRLEAPEKVRGLATYAYEWPVLDPAYLYPLQAEIAVGRVAEIDASAALAQPGVLAVLTRDNAMPGGDFADPEVAVLRSDAIAFRGQLIGAVVAETSEVARDAAGLVRVTYEQRPHDIDFRADRDDLQAPVNTAFFGAGGGDLQDGSPAASASGDVEAALAAAAVTVDQIYRTAPNHHNPLEPHAATAVWQGDELILHASTQGVHATRQLVASALGVPSERVRVISPHVGGAFGSKVYPATYATLVSMAARLVPGRPVKFALTRRQMFSLVGYRPPSIQRVRLGADADGRLTAIAHDSIQQTARAKGYAEQIATCSRTMYAAPNRRTTHRVAALDVPVPTIMRAPGESSGMFALESAMDELAIGCGIDPVEFRIRNEPVTHPETGRPWSSRGLIACLRAGARRFGWAPRDPAPRARRDGRWLVGTGMAASVYPSPRLPGNTATIRLGGDGRYAVLIGAADIGTGTWTALTQIAADALGVDVADVDLRIGDTALPLASSAGLSSGINCWGTTIWAAAGRLRRRLDSEYGGMIPAEGIEASADMPDNPDLERYAMYGFGAQFAEVRVDADTGEVRVARLLGVFDAGRIINPKTARSQLIGGMTQGMSMALHEHSVVDPRFGHVINGDLAGYHFAANADVLSIEAYTLQEEDRHINPMRSKGIGEICLVGTAAAIANAVHHATGVRVRDLPITLDKLVT